MTEADTTEELPQPSCGRAEYPRNYGPMEDYDGYAKITGPCGDTMEVWLRVGNGKVTHCTFATDGCGSTRACGSMVVDLAIGKSVVLAGKIEQDGVLKVLGGLPEKSKHCALLAVNTLRAALKDFGEGRMKGG